MDKNLDFAERLNTSKQTEKRNNASDFSMLQDSATHTQQDRVRKTTRKPLTQQKPKRASANSKNKPKSSISKTSVLAIYRKRRRTAAALVFFAVLTVGLVISANLFLRIESFSLSGECNYTLEEIKDVFGYKEGGAIYGFNVLSSEEKIMEKLPYIQEIKIRRRLPGGIVFEVTKASESFFVAYNNDVAILSRTHKVLRFAQTADAGLVEIRGVEAEHLQVGKNCTFTDKRTQEVLVEMALMLERFSPEHVTAINVSDLNAINFVWENRITVVLGSRADLNKKIKYATTLLIDIEQSGISPSDTGKLDLSEYPSNPNVLMS